MHEFKDVATWIGGLGSGPDQTLTQRALASGGKGRGHRTTPWLRGAKKLCLRSATLNPAQRQTKVAAAPFTASAQRFVLRPGRAINRRMNEWPVSTFKRGVTNDRFVGGH